MHCEQSIYWQHEYKIKLYCSNFKSFHTAKHSFFSLFSLPKKWDYAFLYICSSSIFIKSKTGFAISINKSCMIANVFFNSWDNIEMQWMAVIEFSHAYYCLENAFSRITFKRYRLFSGILMTNTRKHNKINACYKPDFTTFEWQTRI